MEPCDRLASYPGRGGRNAPSRLILEKKEMLALMVGNKPDGLPGVLAFAFELLY